MSRGLDLTFQTLATTTNEAAVEVLVAALDSASRELREAALSALIARRSPLAQGEILLRWRSLSERWKAQVADRYGWLSAACKQAILGADEWQFECGCEAASFTRDYDLIPTLVAVAEQRDNPRSSRAAAAVLELAELLAEELAAPRDYRLRRDPQLQRQHVMASLERAAEQFRQHRHRELLEALLLLAERENAVLKRLLQSPSDPNFAPLVETLIQTSRPAAMRLLLSYLDDPFAPLSTLSAMTRRRDITFLRQLVRKVGGEPSETIRGNLRRIEAIPWIAEQRSLLDSLSEAEQPGVVSLAVAAGISRRQAFEVLAYVLKHGRVTGRRVAARLLAEFAGPDADQLVERALQDDDAQVRAALALQLRQRGVPGAINRLIALLESPHQAEREAAQASLAEFRYAQFSASFDSLTEEARRTSGPLVRRVDPQSVVEVRMDLESSSRSRRRRGLDLAVALDAVALLHDAIAALLKDEDHFLRAEVVHVLAANDSPRTRQAIRTALLDSHPLVQQAAEAAMGKLTPRTVTDSDRPTVVLTSAT